MDLQFESLSPEQAAQSNAKIIITTKDEAKIVRRNDVLFDTELDKYPLLLKAKILRSIMGQYEDDQLTIGIDPGNRIGISIIYLHNELESLIEFSTDSVIQLLSVLLSNIDSKKKVIRIGDGDLVMAKDIAVKIKKKFKELVHIELVNEYGTSLPQNIDANKRGARDRSSARAIALRRGRIFEPFTSYLYKRFHN